MTANRHRHPAALEDYALLGDGVTAALVSRAGSVDWLCFPRFDSPACFAALLGTPENGCWSLSPREANAQIRRNYRSETLILETVFTTEHGEVSLIDFMAVGETGSHLVRLLQGRRGVVAMDMRLALRFGYGGTPAAFEPLADGSGLAAIAGADRVELRTPVALQQRDLALAASVAVAAGQTIPFVLSCGTNGIDPLRALEKTERLWRAWSQRGSFAGPHADAVRRSLLTLKALTYAPTGAMVAAPTTSLPEQAGASRNWDYRYCWLRDSALAVLALLDGGHAAEPLAWRDWLLRAASAPVQIMYGVGGERELREWQVDFLPGYQNARPVRIGNAAHGQLQLDVFGEIATALHRLREVAPQNSDPSWPLQLELTEQLIGMIGEPDEGIWETRGGRRHFTHSKVMAWVALDRAIASAERFALPGPIERWKTIRAELHTLICDRGFDRRLNSFVQSFGADRLDASLLLLPAVGFLPADDPRMAGTIAAIERSLLRCGLVQRYDTGAGEDGLPPGEGAFLACSFWLVDCYALQGRLAEAHQLFERLLSLRNDVGLLAEQYDAENNRLVGNFPQAFSHLALINSAVLLARPGPPAPRSADASRPCDRT